MNQLFSNEYSQLTDLVKSGRLEIIFIISTPRSSSTALERALSNSPDIDIQINDPWSLYDDEDRELKTYQYILDKVLPLVDSKRKVRVLIKNVADYIPPGESWQRQFDLNKHTIFLVRNPLLALESLMQIMAKSISPETYVFPKASMNEYAKQKGYGGWEDMKDQVIKSRNYLPLEDVYREYFPNEQQIHQSQVMRTSILKNLSEDVVKDLGYSSLDDYAKSKDYENWKALLNNIENNPHKFNKIQDLLKRIFLCRITGWEALSQHYENTDKDKNSISILDSTFYRAEPEKILPEIAKKCGVSFSETMINWLETKKSFNTDYEGTVPYYDKAVQTIQIEPPTEDLITIDRFPSFIQKHILDATGALHIYMKLIKDMVRLYPQLDSVEFVTKSRPYGQIMDIDPVLSYLILSLINKEEANKYLQYIKDKHTDHAKVFSVINQCITHEPI